MRRALSTFALTQFVVMACAAPLLAQEAAEEPLPAAYMTLIQEAVEESAAEHWVEARSLFLEAQQVYPNARALRGIGMTSYELRDYTGAYTALRAALAETRRALDVEQRMQVEALLARVNRLIGRFTVDHLGETHSVTVDGVRQTLGAGAGEFVLMTTGEHQVTVVLADLRRVTGRLIVRGGEEGPLPLELPAPELAPEQVAEAATRVESPAAPEEATAPRDPRVLRAVGWVSVGTGVALVAVGTALVAVGRTDKTFLETADRGTVWDDVERFYERSPRFLRGGSVALVLGAAAAATGLVLVLRAGDDGAADADEATDEASGDDGDADDADDDDDAGDERAVTPPAGPHVQARVAPTGAQLEVMW